MFRISFLSHRWGDNGVVTASINLVYLKKTGLYFHYQLSETKTLSLCSIKQLSEIQKIREVLSALTLQLGVRTPRKIT